MDVTLWAARAGLALLLTGWSYALTRVLINRFRPRWVLTPEHPSAPIGESVSIVIPARNEAANIGPCLDAALAQDHTNLQIVVMDDGSTDGTGAILKERAADPRVMALSGDGGALPEGWYGKPWALQRAQEAATGDWLLFIDADVRLAPEAVSRAVAYAREQQLGLLSGFGNAGMDSFWEHVLQPAVAGLILAGNNLDRINDPEVSDKVIANGQFLLFSRDAYDAVGGHNAVAGNILDDVGLAEAVTAAGIPMQCLYMRRIFTCRMYTGLGEIWEGWSKNLFAGMGYSWGATLGAMVFTFLASQLGWVLAVAGLVGAVDREFMWWGIALVAVMQTVRAVTDWIWEAPLRYGLTHIPGNLMLIGLLLNSAIKTSGGGVTWKGRTYQPKPQESAEPDAEG